ncbi:MAG: O-antigen ligase family protein [Pseudomonadota bacterium]
MSAQFALTILGYPIVGVLSSLLGSESSVAAIALRGLMVAVSLLMVALSLRRSSVAGGISTSFVALFFVYSLRLLIDYYSGDYPTVGWDATQYYGFCMVPLFGLVALSGSRDADRDMTVMFLAGFFVCALFAVVTIAGVNAVSTEEFQGRVSVARLNPISVGHMAVSTIIAALAVVMHERPSRFARPLAIVASCAALYCLVITESRGPLLSLGGAALVFLAIKRQWKALIVFAVVGFAIAMWSNETGGGVLDRLQGIGTDQSSLERLDVQALAIAQFVKSPIFGGAHVEIVTGAYPHNILLDAAMSTGLIGLLLLLWIFVRLVIGCRNLLRRGEILLPLLATQYAIGAQFSGSMFGSPEFWTCTALVLAVTSRNRRAKQRSVR